MTKRTKDAIDLVNEAVESFRQLVEGKPIPSQVKFATLRLEYDVSNQSVVVEWEFSHNSSIYKSDGKYRYTQRS
jgi:hypothetical protein